MEGGVDLHKFNSLVVSRFLRDAPRVGIRFMGGSPESVFIVRPLPSDFPLKTDADIHDMRNALGIFSVYGEQFLEQSAFLTSESYAAYMTVPLNKEIVTFQATRGYVKSLLTRPTLFSEEKRIALEAYMHSLELRLSELGPLPDWNGVHVEPFWPD